MQQRGAVFLQDPALFHKFIECVAVAIEIIFAAGVALRNGLARIAGLLALGCGLRERQIGSFESHTLIG